MLERNTDMELLSLLGDVGVPEPLPPSIARAARAALEGEIDLNTKSRGPGTLRRLGRRGRLHRATQRRRMHGQRRSWRLRLPAAVWSVARRRSVTVAAAIAAVAIASLFGVQTLTGGGGAGSTGTPLSVAPAAAAQLKRVAQAAAGQAMPAAGQWEYLAIKQENTATLSNNSGSVTVVYTDTQTEQNWIAANGDTRQRDSNDSFSFLTPQDKATYLADKAVLHVGSRFPGYDPTVPGVIEDRMFPDMEHSPPVWETSPPSDPHTLITELWHQYESAMPRFPAGRLLPDGRRVTRQQTAERAKAVAAQRPEILWDDLGGLLLYSTSARLRATAYRALADVPDTTVGGTDTDQLGRSGIAVTFTGARGQADTLIASPASGDLLEEDTALTTAADGLPAGTVTNREIFLQRAIGDSDSTLPGGGTQPFDPTLK